MLINTYDTTGGVNVSEARVPPFFPKEDLAARMLVINGLRQYVAGLKELVSNEKLDEFDAKTMALGKQLSELNTTGVGANILNSTDVSAQQINIFTTAINTIGRWMVEYRREKIVNETVRTMKDAVRQVSNLMAEDIGGRPHREGTSDLDPTPLGERIPQEIVERLLRHYSQS